MPAELLNVLEISKIISEVAPSAGHSGLLEAINTRYPNTPFRLLQEFDDRTWDIGIIDQSGDRVSDKLGHWVDQQLAEADGNTRQVWEKYKDRGMLRTERKGSVLYLTSPYGPDPDQFFQLQILVGPEIAERTLFRTDQPWPEFPEDRADLVLGWSMADKHLVLSPARYQLDELINIRKYIKDLVEGEKAWKLSRLPEMEAKVIRVQEVAPGEESIAYGVPYLDMCPEWLDRLPHAFRLFVDWKESSAGRGGHRFCDHWWIKKSGWTESNGCHRRSLIPQWAESDGGLNLPEIDPSRDDSPYLVMDELVKFDELTGYPFSWFFYMLHGNRVMSYAGVLIANALKNDKIRLPECDETVLLRWVADGYGF